MSLNPFPFPFPFPFPPPLPSPLTFRPCPSLAPLLRPPHPAGAFHGCLDDPLCGEHAPAAVAARSGHAEVVALLLRLGASPLARDANGWTLAHVAAHQGHVAVLRVLIAAPGSGATALLLARTPSGAVPLFLAAQEGHHAATVFLITRAPMVADVPREDGCSPFFIACQEGHLACAVALAPLAEIARRTHRGSTALHAAVLQVGLGGMEYEGCGCVF